MKYCKITAQGKTYYIAASNHTYIKDFIKERFPEGTVLVAYITEEEYFYKISRGEHHV